MDFKKYNKIINDNKYDMLMLIIYYNLKCNDEIGLDNVDIENENVQDELNKLISFIYNAYLKDETHTDLGYICDEAVRYKNDILNNNMTRYDFLEKCYLDENRIF